MIGPLLFAIVDGAKEAVALWESQGSRDDPVVFLEDLETTMRRLRFALESAGYLTVPEVRRER